MNGESCLITLSMEFAGRPLDPWMYRFLIDVARGFAVFQEKEQARLRREKEQHDW